MQPQYFFDFKPGHFSPLPDSRSIYSTSAEPTQTIVMGYRHRRDGDTLPCSCPDEKIINTMIV